MKRTSHSASAFKVLRHIHRMIQSGIWVLSLLFLLIRSVTSGIPGADEASIIALITFEFSLFVWFLHYTARYFLNDRKARRHWVLPSAVLFVFLTSPFAFSLARAALSSYP